MKAVALIVLVGTVLADKPDWNYNKKGADWDSKYPFCSKGHSPVNL